MRKFTYKAHRVVIFEGYNGDSMFINDPKGNQIYAHKFTGDAFERAKQVINGN